MNEEMRMTSKHLVDPEILPMLDMFPGLNLTRESLPQMRALLKEMNAQMLAEEEGVLLKS